METLHGKYEKLIEMEISLNSFTTKFLGELIQSMSDSDIKKLIGYQIDDYKEIVDINPITLTVEFSEGDTYTGTLGYLTQIETSCLIGYIFDNIL